MTEIYRGITIEGQKALDKFADEMWDVVDRVMSNITHTILDTTWKIEDMNFHSYYLRGKMYNNVIDNVLTPIINNKSKESKND